MLIWVNEKSSQTRDNKPNEFTTNGSNEAICMHNLIVILSKIFIGWLKNKMISFFLLITTIDV